MGPSSNRTGILIKRRGDTKSIQAERKVQEKKQRSSVRQGERSYQKPTLPTPLFGLPPYRSVRKQIMFFKTPSPLHCYDSPSRLIQSGSELTSCYSHLHLHGYLHIPLSKLFICILINIRILSQVLEKKYAIKTSSQLLSLTSCKTYQL